MPLLPNYIFAQCVVALVLFMLGWGGCTMAMLRMLGWRAPDLAATCGFVAWVALIVGTGLVLPLVGLFHPWLFVALPLLVAVNGWRGVRQATWRRWFGMVRVMARDEPWLAGAVVLAVYVVWSVAWLNLSYPMPGWDAISYHQPISLLFLQEGRYWDLPATYEHVNSYPKSGEILAAWVLPAARWVAALMLVAVPTWIAGVAAGTYILRTLGLGHAVAFLLMVLTAGYPVVLMAMTRDATNVDLLLAVMMVAAVAMMLDVYTRPVVSWPMVGMVLVAVGLCPGIKASGLLLGGFLGAVLLAVLALRRVGVARWLGVAVAGVLVAAALSGYWLATNYLRFGNPVHPVTLAVGTVEIFSGEYRVEEYIGGAERLKGKTGFAAFRRSVEELHFSAHLWGGERLGGWGWHFRNVLMHLWPVAFVLALWRRQWPVAAIMAVATGLLLLTPSYWWSRFSMQLMLLSPVAAVPVLTLAGRWPTARQFLLMGWIVSTVGTGFTAARDVWFFYPRPQMRATARSEGRRHAVQQDARPMLLERRHQLYAWIVRELPAGATLAYDLGEDEDHLAMMIRPDGNSRAYNVKLPETVVPDADFLVIHATGDQRVFWAGHTWRLVWTDDRYAAFRRME